MPGELRDVLMIEDAQVRSDTVRVRGTVNTWAAVTALSLALGIAWTAAIVTAGPNYLAWGVPWWTPAAIWAAAIWVAWTSIRRRHAALVALTAAFASLVGALIVLLIVVAIYGTD
jgi:hypothetical protein